LYVTIIYPALLLIVSILRKKRGTHVADKKVDQNS
jgi:spore germination protein